MSAILEEIDRQMLAGPVHPKWDTSDSHTERASTELDRLEYRMKLVAVRDAMNGRLDLPIETRWDNFNFPDQTLFWKIPSFCRPYVLFITPEYLRQKSESIRTLRRRYNPQSIDTQDIWSDPGAAAWMADTRPSILLVSGNPRLSNKVETFGLELVEYLEERNQRFVYIPALFRDSRVLGKDVRLDAVAILRNITVQCLQKANDDSSIPFLASVIFQSKRATTATHWELILRMVLFHTRDLFIVVDVTSAFDSSADAGRLSKHLQNVFSKIQNSILPPLQKIALLNCELPQESPVAQSHAHLVIAKEPLILPPRTAKRFQNVPRLNKWKGSGSSRPELYISPGGFHDQCYPLDQSPVSAKRDDQSNLQQPDHSSAYPANTAARPISRDQIEIAFICALPVEADAINAVFDRHWDDKGLPFKKAPGDTNTYSVGAIGRHNVVMVHMAGMGKINAAIAAVNCSFSFTNIKLALVVGICGAVPFYPSGEEILLGDVIISNGVVQYDFGRQFPGGFARKSTLPDVLGRPNMELRGLLSKLSGNRGRWLLGQGTATHLAALQKTSANAAHHPGSTHDILYAANYVHAGERTCEEVGCDGNLVLRNRLKEQKTEPFVHFGLIASGDKVMRSGEERDQLARKEGVIAFEMEGAGIWECFPCVVIKGVSDYADSHKSNAWQRYAAATAAVCAKAFLTHWAGSSVS